MSDPFDPTREDGTSVPVGPGETPTTFDASVVDFGHHAGRRIEDLAEEDPNFLYWLARHPSGARYRAEIARVMGAKLGPREY
jgi:hypothetical protein